MSNWPKYAERTYRQIEDFDKSRVIVIPSGAVEVYGPHLPLGSDSIVAQKIAELVAERIGGLCGPLVPVGYSADLMSFPGTLTVAPEVFKAYLGGICDSLIGWGFKRFIFLNTHAGNVGVIDQIADRLISTYGTVCLQIDWWRFSGPLAADVWETGQWAIGHASEQGTSMLLHLAPELVDLEAAVDFVPERPISIAGAEDYTPFNKIAPSSVLGRPSTASAEKGRIAVERAVDQIVVLAQAMMEADPS